MYDTCMRLYTREQVRNELEKRIANSTQSDVARQIGVTRQLLSYALRGGSIRGKILDWLGFEVVERYGRKK
jgi:predicted transcriptional regulator